MKREGTAGAKDLYREGQREGKGRPVPWSWRRFLEVAAGAPKGWAVAGPCEPH